jgi:hypothetical protein
MKPNIFPSSLALAASLAAASCAPASSDSAPVSTPTPTPVQTSPRTTQQPVVQEVRYANYLDAPQTPGAWEYAQFDFGSQALYRSDPLNSFAFSCNRSAGQINFIRFVSGGAQRVMRIQTETTQRSLTAASTTASQNSVTARVSANDSLLDAMAITKGRFAVETEGLPTLYIPAWAEVSRVIEDCR